MFADEDVYIIYITTPHNTHYGFMKKALENGMNAHITKPLDIKVLLETLEKILRMRQHL